MPTATQRRDLEVAGTALEALMRDMKTLIEGDFARLKTELEAAGVPTDRISTLLALEMPRAIQEAAHQTLARMTAEGITINETMSREALLAQARAFEEAGLIRNPADAPPGRSAAEHYVDTKLGVHAAPAERPAAARRGCAWCARRG